MAHKDEVETRSKAVRTPPYRGRIAPTPSGYLHMGHARTFWVAYERALARRGTLVLRIEDLDPQRSRSEFVQASIEDLEWFGFQWDEGPNQGGPHAPYFQSQRTARYRDVLQELVERQLVYRCYCSRKDILSATQAPHEGDEGPLYPGTCRPNTGPGAARRGRNPCWRFRVPTERRVEFVDKNLGALSYDSGVQFGDFVVWRQDDVPSYQLAVTVDDHDMAISEVVRGDDLLVSAARQILLYEALGWEIPDFYHCPLMRDSQGERLSKRADSIALRELRANGMTPDVIRSRFSSDIME